MNPPPQHCATSFPDRVMDFTTAVGNHVSVSNDTAGRTVDKEWTSEKSPTSMTESNSFHARGTFLFPNLTNQKRRTDLKGCRNKFQEERLTFHTEKFGFWIGCKVISCCILFWLWCFYWLKIQHIWQLFKLLYLFEPVTCSLTLKYFLNNAHV